MAQFVDGFLKQPLLQQRGIGRHAVNFFAQPVQGNHGAISTQLCLPEDEGKHRNKQVESRDTQHPPIRGQRLQSLQDSRRVILPPSRVKSETDIQRLSPNPAVDPKDPRKRRNQTGKFVGRKPGERDESDGRQGRNQGKRKKSKGKRQKAKAKVQTFYNPPCRPIEDGIRTLHINFCLLPFDF